MTLVKIIDLGTLNIILILNNASNIGTWICLYLVLALLNMDSTNNTIMTKESLMN